MKRAALLKRLDYLENHDPRRDPRHHDCSVWIWERDQVEAELRQLDKTEAPAHTLRPPLKPIAEKALSFARSAANDVPLWIAVELTEAGYVMEQWPEHTPFGNLWRCAVSDGGGRIHPVTVRVVDRRLIFDGVALVVS